MMMTSGAPDQKRSSQVNDSMFVVGVGQLQNLEEQVVLYICAVRSVTHASNSGYSACLMALALHSRDLTSTLTRHSTADRVD